jgi:AraC-like DNA-binding protein
LFSKSAFKNDFAPLYSPRMVSRTHRPGWPLSQLIEFFWFHEGLVSEHRRERVLPNGRFELVINLDPIPRKLFDRHDHTRYREFHRAWLSGTHSEFIVIDVLPRSSMMGIHFRPGGVAPFLALPAGELTDEVVEANDVWGVEADNLHDAILEQPTADAKFRVLEQFLLRTLRRRAKRCEAVDYAVRAFMANPHEIRIRAIVAQLGISHKQFISRFRDQVGLTPKRFCRVLRFQRVLSEIEERKAVEWADVASAGGYYDQAHFINDFHAFTGLNPSTYLTQRGEHLNFVPVST